MDRLSENKRTQSSAKARKKTAQDAQSLQIKLLNDELVRTKSDLKIAQKQLREQEQAAVDRKSKEKEQQVLESKLEHYIAQGFADIEKATKSEVPYLLGREVVASVRKPRKLIMLPLSLKKIVRNARLARQQGMVKSVADIKNQIHADLKNFLYPQPVLSSDEIQACENRTQLRASFWPAFRIHDISTCHAIINRLAAINSESPRKGEAQSIEKLSSKLPSEVSLFDAIEYASEPAFESVENRACYFLHNSLPVSSGGYATRAHGLATALSADGIEVIATTRPGFPLDNIRGLSASEVTIEQDIDDIQYCRLLEPQRSGLKIFDYLERAADAVEAHLRKHRPAIVIAASNYYTGLPALIAARRLGLPFIYEVRGFWEITRVSREPDFVNHISYATQEFMEAELCRNSDHVFTLTRAMKGELVRRGVPIEKIELLPNACNPENFTPRVRSEKLAEKWGIPISVPVIGYIGSFVQYEGLENLATACGVLKERGIEFRLMIVGNENVSGGELGPIASAIVENAEAAGFRDWLIMPGRVPHEDVPDYYSLIDIAPFPRKPQPVTEMVSPMKPLEAMAMQKTVLVSSVGAMQEMVIEGVTGHVFEKGSIVDMADKLEMLASSALRRKKIGKAAREWVCERRTWEHTGSIASKAIKRTIETHTLSDKIAE